MLKSSSGRLQSTALALALAVLSACSGPPPAPPSVAPLDAVQAAARTRVPLTRPVALDKPGVIADLEFDLPPPGELAGSSLVIGIRIAEETPKAIVARSSLIVREGLPARVRLQKLDGESRTDVSLLRIAPELKKRVELGADGFTPKASPHSVNTGMMREAGLLQDGLIYDELALAYAGSPAPGRYHVVIELLEDRPALKDSPAELIIAYDGKSK
ncbi:hypothetical protein H9654_10930 [Stenotrophomonas sp. Sa5BUN4]|uniref:Lipoprotein n=1 Tax=Stenotrophomonas lacuserhaii TaxID=2760084 RepID=A0A8X8FQE9_9GAMM|nr:hypothetical protein [Stenotrophomonas pennii]MBD7954712.1 hypothetical protein [Stenotrophomonas pennii]